MHPSGQSHELTDSQWSEILTRLRKVQALTDSPNIHEAAAAAAKLQELLFRYNLSLSEIVSDGADPANSYTKEWLEVGFAMGDTGDWRLRLIGRLARVNFCRAFIAGDDTSMILLGEPHNIFIVREMYEYLTSEVVRLAHRDWRKYRARLSKAQTRDEIGVWVRSFCHGATVTISGRLDTQQQKSMSVSEQSKALVVMKEQELDMAESRFIGKTTSVSFDVQTSSAGYHTGVRAGKEVSLNPQVRASDAPPISGPVKRERQR